MRSRQPEISKSGELSSNHRILQTSYTRDVLNTWGININLRKHTMYHVRLFFVTPGANISPPWTSINTWKMIHFLKISFQTSPPFFGLTFVHSRRRKKGWRLNKKCELKAPLRNVYYLVVEPTHLTNIRQNGNLTQNRGEHKKNWNHHT